MLNKRVEYSSKTPIRAYVSRIYEQPVHNHQDDLEIIVVLKGSVKEIIGYRTILLKEGEVMIINDRDIHGTYETEEENLVLTIHINTAYFKKFNPAAYGEFFLMAATYLNDRRYDRPVEELRDKLFDIAKAQITQSSSDEKMDTLGKELLAMLLENFQYFYYSTAVGGYFINRYEGKNNQAQAARIRSLMYYLWENFNQKITLQEYADENHINMYYLSHVIKESTGLNFQDMLNFIRVEESEPLLLDTDKKISEIAFDCGFSATRYYVKHFERWFNVSPEEYRAKHLSRVKLKMNETILDGDSAIEAINEFSSEKRHLVSCNSHYYTKVLELDANKENRVRRKGFSQILTWDRALLDECDADLNQIGKAFKQCIPIKKTNDFDRCLRKLLQEDPQRSLLINYTGDDSNNNNNEKLIVAAINFIAKAELKKIHINIRYQGGVSEQERKHIESTLKTAGEESYCAVQIKDISNQYKKAFRNNYIMDSIYIVPWIIRSNLKKGHEQKFINSIKDSQDNNRGLIFGGNGILTSNAIKKPAYYAYMCLSKLGDEVLYNLDGYVVTRKNQDIIILLYDYNSDYFTDVDKFCDWNTLADFRQSTERKMNYKLDLINLNGEYTVTELRIGNETCLFKKMVNLKMPEIILPEEEKYMREFMKPQLRLSTIEGKEKNASMEVKVPKYGATLLEFHKKL